ncbi:MAG TPA: 2Fe-2S iron-sulfur cluster-binding protein, partial [Thermodesulfobacteriota bacterium]|nr:2Fe-2S iron-sulfur cluster-binding protein [Thermodesulfobacteriota bacterium]
MNDIVRIEIERFDPEEGRSYSQVYEVPRGTKTRVLDFLVYIFEEIDPSLAYRRHLCKARMCNGCLMMVNGKARFACWEIVSPEEREIRLSPLEGKRIFKDLVVDLGKEENEG